ncbi:hypothetical protein [Aquimarina hainanensis]
MKTAIRKHKCQKALKEEVKRFEDDDILIVSKQLFFDRIDETHTVVISYY